MGSAPIAFFAYNRPEHVRQSLQALSSADGAVDTRLFIYCDGPKDSGGADHTKVQEVRDVVRSKKWTGDVQVIEQDTNLGLGLSVVNGVNDVLEEHDRVIVLEDDLIVSQGFLRYMNSALDKFGNTDNIYSITGFMFPLSWPGNGVKLLPYISTWSWATWRHRWEGFDPFADIDFDFEMSPSLKAKFNLGNFDYASLVGKDLSVSWGIRWYYHVFLRNGLNVFPTKTLVRNIGFDENATNTNSGFRQEEGLTEAIEVEQVDAIDLQFLECYEDFFKDQRLPRSRRLMKYLRFGSVFSQTL